MSDNAKVCSNHFRSGDFITTLTEKRALSTRCSTYWACQVIHVGSKDDHETPKGSYSCNNSSNLWYNRLLTLLFSYNNRPSISLPLSAKKAIAVHTDRYHSSFFVKCCIVINYYQLVQTHICWIFLILSLPKLQCVRSKKLIVFIHFKKKNCKISNKTVLWYKAKESE